MDARLAVAAVAILATSTPAVADRAEPPGLIPRVVRQALRAAAPRTPPPVDPPLRIPTPQPVTWRAAKLGSIELGAPLLALASADLGGAAGAALYAVTTRAVVVLAVTAKGKVSEVARYPFGGPIAVPQPRDPVGAVYVEGGQVVASASPWTTELRLAATGPVPAPTAVPAPGQGLCPHERRPLVAGRNYYEETGAPLYAVACTDAVVARDGTPLHLRAALGAQGKLVVTSQRCRGAACEPVTTLDYAGVGTAFTLDDVDSDGTPELIISGAGAPGDADAVKVIVLGGDVKKGVFRKVFHGGVAAIATLPRRPGGRTVIAAVRLAGATRIDLWRLN